MRALSGQNDLDYGEGINFNLLAFLGDLDSTVVDLGCGTGGWAPMLRAAGATRIVGVEPSAGADLARTRFDEVFSGTVEDAPASLFVGASLVVLADVLEHLIDPWNVLRRLRDCVEPGTKLAISVPNVQSVRVWLPIALRGRFDYSDIGGPMDRGHLRWFTQRTLHDAVADAGWAPERMGGVLLGRVATTLMTATGGRGHGLAYHQLHLLARA